jgi:hypothetical protein
VLHSVLTPGVGGRVGNNLNSFADFYAENGSTQGQILALAGQCVPGSLDSGLVTCVPGVTGRVGAS